MTEKSNKLDKNWKHFVPPFVACLSSAVLSADWFSAGTTTVCRLSILLNTTLPVLVVRYLTASCDWFPFVFPLADGLLDVFLSPLRRVSDSGAVYMGERLGFL